mmetsp:Transcript_21018/g.46116  ORF Transcript_21018/g.46116 Transcript_21018/m.46116 type:complete len:307 (-) Transcript_21018:1001-1921(-)
MLHLQLRRRPPYRLLAGEGLEQHRVQRTGHLYAALLKRLLRISCQRGFSVLVLNAVVRNRAHNGAAHGGHAGALRILRVAQPVVSPDHHACTLQGLDGPPDDFVRHVRVAIRLLQLGRSDPDAALSGKRLARSVQNLLSVLVRLQLGQGQPQVHLVGAALHGAVQKHLGIVHVHQLNGGLPQAHTVGHTLKSLLEHPQLCRFVGLQRGGRHPQPHRVRDLSHTSRQHRLGVVPALFGVHARGLQPHVLTLGAVLTRLLQQLLGLGQVTRQLLEAHDGDPAGCVVGVCLRHALEQQAGLLDVSNVCV